MTVTAPGSTVTGLLKAGRGPFGFGVRVAVISWLVPAFSLPVSGLSDR
jgi:hypothetical protein